MIPRWLQAVALVAALAALVWGVQRWEARAYDRGYQAAQAEAREREERLSRQAAQEQATALEAAREKDREYRRWHDQLVDRHYQENKDYERTIAHLRAAARAGQHGMSIAVTAGALPRCSAAADSAPAAGSGGETRADVMPEVADAVLGVAADLARGVRDRNAYIDLYNRARAECNGGD